MKIAPLEGVAENSDRTGRSEGKGFPFAVTPSDRLISFTHERQTYGGQITAKHYEWHKERKSKKVLASLDSSLSGRA